MLRNYGDERLGIDRGGLRVSNPPRNEDVAAHLTEGSRATLSSLLCQTAPAPRRRREPPRFVETLLRVQFLPHDE